MEVYGAPVCSTFTEASALPLLRCHLVKYKPCIYSAVFYLLLKPPLFCFLWEPMRLKQEDRLQTPSYIQEMQEMEKKSSDQANAVQITV